ncbi:MAG: hypothetical protein MHPSP_001305, partial [Paramarteilia canceri]
TSSRHSSLKEKHLKNHKSFFSNLDDNLITDKNSSAQFDILPDDMPLPDDIFIPLPTNESKVGDCLDNEIQNSETENISHENMDIPSPMLQNISDKLPIFKDSSLLENNVALPKIKSHSKNNYKNIDTKALSQYQLYLYENMPSRIILRHKRSTECLWGTRLISEFKFRRQIGEGTYGMVYKALDIPNDKVVAIKKVRTDSEKDGLSIFVVREIKILKQLSHQNVISLIDVLVDNIQKNEPTELQPSIYLVFEYMEHDLMGLLEFYKKKNTNLEDNQICFLMKQLLEGVAYCHHKGFMHRDLKCSNILVDKKGIIKLADFGLGRPYQKPNKLQNKSKTSQRPYTNKVITLWYRPPELLLGAEHYTPAVDVWSLGCILGEMFFLRPLFSANSEVGMLDVIFKTCGTPNPENWPKVDELPTYNAISRWKHSKRALSTEYNDRIDADPLDLLDSMLVLDPSVQHLWIASFDFDSMKQLNLPDDINLNELYSKSDRKTSKSQKHSSLASTTT